MAAYGPNLRAASGDCKISTAFTTPGTRVPAADGLQGREGCEIAKGVIGPVVIEVLGDGVDEESLPRETAGVALARREGGRAGRRGCGAAPRRRDRDPSAGAGCARRLRPR